MSQENVEIVRETVKAWNRHDLERLIEICSEQVEGGPANPGAVERTIYRGRDDVLRGWETTWETSEELHFEERETRDLGDSVLTVSFLSWQQGLEAAGLRG